MLYASHVAVAIASMQELAADLPAAAAYLLPRLTAAVIANATSSSCECGHHCPVLLPLSFYGITLLKPFLCAPTSM
jgi:hypothetical protein